MDTTLISHYGHKITYQISQLYRKLLPNPCLLCGAYDSNHILCSLCLADLPHLGNVCPQCASPTPTSVLCGSCLKSPPNYQITHSLYSYKAPIDQLIIQMKYHDKLALCQFFAQQLYQQIKDKPLPDMLIAIPLHPKRIKNRGYNQSWEITKILGKKLNIPISSTVLSRVRDTLPQASLPYSERKKNMVKAFKVKQKPNVDRIALIDDVVTTGHTANIAAYELQKAGVDHIELWTIARAIRHD